MLMLKKLVESKGFQSFIIAVIIINGIVLGVQTSRTLSPATMQLLDFIDMACLAVFCVEILMKFVVYRLGFFRSGWNIFDLAIVVIALVPSSGSLSILRAFRILRVLRLVTAIASFRRVVSGMLLAIPGVGSVAGLLLLVFYISGVLSTMLFGEDFPQWFGTLGKSMYSLFQIMTLESWSMGIVRPVMEVQPYAWVFFIPFITITTFTVLNLFIGIVVDAMATVKEAETEELHKDHTDIESMLADLQREVKALRAEIAQKK
ncbi:MAG: ion transporter [Acidiferrobacterales bacterium]|nr:ion transporter [Acidiferrobacterales bacterium]